jgi:hypothetical protein
MDMGIATVDRKYVFAMTYEAKDTVAAALKLRLLLVRHDLLTSAAMLMPGGPGTVTDNGPQLRRGMPPNAQGYFRDRYANLRRLAALLQDPDAAARYLIGDLWISEPAANLTAAAPWREARLGAQLPNSRSSSSSSGRGLATRVSRSGSIGPGDAVGMRASPQYTRHSILGEAPPRRQFGQGPASIRPQKDPPARIETTALYM